MSKYPCIVKFYKIYSEQEPEFVYVGSTTKKYLCQRMGNHKTAYKVGHKCSSYLILEKYDDAIIELLWEGNVLDFNERNEIERSYTECYDACNKKVQGRTKKEYNIKWNNENDEYFKLYREHHKEKYKLQKAEYYLNNKEHLDNKNKQHYLDNKAKILLVQSERIICECGKEIAKGKKARHIKTHHHIISVNR